LLRYEMPGYTTYDASLGVSRNQWTMTAYGQNLTNSSASTYTSSNEYVLAQTILRPRVLGLKFRYTL
jgi:iron complex outermembrane recepter protein